MKILILNDVGAPHGGAERLTLSLRDGLRERGHDARVLASDAPSPAGPNRADYACFGTTSRWRTLNRIANPSAALELRRVLRIFRPDVVHVRMFLSQLSPLILPALREVPALYHATWYETVCPLGSKMLPDGSLCHHRAGAACWHAGCLPARAWAPLMLQMRMWQRWRGAFDVIVANSEFVRAHLLAEDIGPIEVVWNGVPVVPQRPALATPPTVTCAGRLVPEKGIEVLLEAFRCVVEDVPEARLLIAGSGPSEPALRRSIERLRLGSRVRMLGQLADAAMETVLGGGWVHAVPSICAESFGLTAAEAMMRGTAVVASRQGGIAEIVVEGDTGFLVPPGDAPALSHALLAVLRDRELAEQLGRSARDRARRLMSRELWIDRFVRLYQRISLDARAPGEG